MDANNHRFKLVSVNWYGAESPDLVPAGLDRNDIHSIARLIKQFGFNSVRIPWALQLVEEDPALFSNNGCGQDGPGGHRVPHQRDV